VSNRFADWIAAYEAAWRTEGTAPLERLFTEEAIYQAAPFDEPLEGVRGDRSVQGRRARRSRRIFTLTSKIVATEGILRWLVSRSSTDIRRSAPIAMVDHHAVQRRPVSPL